MESPSSCRVTLLSSRVFDSSAPSIYLLSAMTSWLASDRAFHSAYRASRDFPSVVSVSAKWAFTASSFYLAVAARWTARISAARAPVASTAQSWDSRRADSS